MNRIDAIAAKADSYKEYGDVLQATSRPACPLPAM
jgi:hypothetical protein